jgi:ferredoxin
MQIRSIKRVYFSPTGTTKAIVQGIARGLDPVSVETIDITRPDVRKQRLRTDESDLLIVGMPVYAGRIPGLMNAWLDRVDANQTPVVCVVVYGNREFEDALLELKDGLKKRGCVPVACAAYIGEHSFSTPETPIAVARPDGDDLEHAAGFGRRIREKLEALTSVDGMPDVDVPGNFPYKVVEMPANVDFIDVGSGCTQCRVCETVCPVEAIDMMGGTPCDTGVCVHCCACIKSCPEGARTMKPSRFREIANRLTEMCRERKTPAWFL